MKKLILIISILSITTIPVLTNAQIPFGGTILWSGNCRCSGGRLLIIADLFSKTTIPIVHQYGISRLNQQFNILTPGIKTLGSYTPGGICLRGEGCNPFPVIGTVTPRPFSGIGTSLTPGF